MGLSYAGENLTNGMAGQDTGEIALSVKLTSTTDAPPEIQSEKKEVLSKAIAICMKNSINLVHGQNEDDVPSTAESQDSERGASISINQKYGRESVVNSCDRSSINQNQLASVFSEYLSLFIEEMQSDGIQILPDEIQLNITIGS